MYEELGHIVLATGEQVDAGVVIGPDAEWAECLEQLLYHKGEPWNWQIQQVLKKDVGIGILFYVLHRAGIPFANIMIAELEGVGFLAHVWTKPEDRKKGACSQLLKLQMHDFRTQQGKALFLFTEFDSVAYHLYEKNGFRSVDFKSGYMDWYATSKDEFKGDYFNLGETEIQTLRWTHWPSSAALFMGDFPGVIRCAPLHLMGRQSTQTPFLSLLYEEDIQPTGHSKGMVLQNKATTAVVGFAAWDWHPLWADTCLVDIYCHPKYWGEAGNLLASLVLPEADRYIAYCEADHREKTEVLLGEGFKPTALYKRRVPSSNEKKSFLDVALFERQA